MSSLILSVTQADWIQVLEVEEVVSGQGILLAGLAENDCLVEGLKRSSSFLSSCP